MITTNYGLKGGTLDASKHIAAALPRLCTPIEQESYLDTILPSTLPLMKEN